MKVDPYPTTNITLYLAHIYLNSISKFTPHNTLKMERKLYFRDITALIDGGTTHAFIRTSLIQELHL